VYFVLSQLAYAFTGSPLLGVDALYPTIACLLDHYYLLAELRGPHQPAPSLIRRSAHQMELLAERIRLCHSGSGSDGDVTPSLRSSTSSSVGDSDEEGADELQFSHDPVLSHPLASAALAVNCARAAMMSTVATVAVGDAKHDLSTSPVSVLWMMEDSSHHTARLPRPFHAPATSAPPPSEMSFTVETSA